MAWLWGRRANTSDTSLFKVTLGLLLAFALMQGVTGTITPTERLFQLANGVDVRLGLWREAARIWLAYPFVGAGFSQFAWQYFMLASESAVTQAPAALLAGGWVAAVLLVLTIHSLLEYPLWYAPFLGIAAILIGAADTHTLRLQLGGMMRAALGLMLVLSWIGLLRMADSYSQLEGLFRAGQTPPSAQEVERVLEHVRHESMLMPYSEFAYAAGITPNREQIEGKVRLNSEVMRFAPTRDVVYRQAILLMLQGEIGAAQAMLKRALGVYPGAAETFLMRADSLEPEVRQAIEPILDSTRIFLQEQKKHAIYSR